MAKELNGTNVTVATALAWCLPGAGHWYLGARKKGLFFFLVLAGTYGAGVLLCGGGHISFDENPFYYIGRYGSGMTFAMGSLLLSQRDVPGDDVIRMWFDPGLLYMCIAGMLNVLVVLSVFNPRLSHWVQSPESAGVTASVSAPVPPAIPASDNPVPDGNPAPSGKEGGGVTT